jgi:transcriptional regulator with XRE-family HTH domain
MSGNHPDGPSVVDRLFETVGFSEPQEEHRVVGTSPRAQRQQQKARPIQLPRDRLAVTFQKCRQASGLSLPKLAQTSGIDVAHIWRIEQGEHSNVSREVLILLSLGMVLDTGTLDHVVEIVNEILDAAGLKMLRAPWEHGAQRPNKHNNSKQQHDKS